MFLSREDIKHKITVMKRFLELLQLQFDKLDGNVMDTHYKELDESILSGFRSWRFPLLINLTLIQMEELFPKIEKWKGNFTNQILLSVLPLL